MGEIVVVDDVLCSARTSVLSPATSLLSCSMRLQKPERTSFKVVICEACFSCSRALLRLSLCSMSMSVESCCCCCFNMLITSLPESVSLASVSTSVSVSASDSRRSGVKASFRGGKKSVFRVDDGSSLSEITESSNISSCDSIGSSFTGLGYVSVITGDLASDVDCDVRG